MEQRDSVQRPVAQAIVFCVKSADTRSTEGLTAWMTLKCHQWVAGEALIHEVDERE